MSPCPWPKKTVYRTPGAAHKACADLAEKWRDYKITVYRCGDHWHVGHRHGGGLGGRIKRALRTADR